MIRVRRYVTKRNDRTTEMLYTGLGPKADFDELKRKNEKIWKALWTSADLRKRNKKVNERNVDFDQMLSVDQILEMLKSLG